MAMNSLARLLIWRVSGGGSGRSLFIWNLLFRERTPTAPTAAEVAEESAPAPGLPMPEAPPAAVAKPHSSTRSPVLWPASHHGNAVRVDRLMTGVLELCLVITVVPLFLILGYLIYRGVGALNWNFFVKLPAPVGQAGGGMANALYGSLLLVGLATLFAVPVGLFAAIYLAEYRSVRLGPAVRFIGELLGGVPSIVIGIFAYAVVVKPMGHFSGWAGGFALGVMMIPIFMRVAEEALRMVPRTIRGAGYALGASRWQVIMGIVVPAALPALITALFLAIARVAGETAPLLLTASSNQFWPSSPGDFTPSLPVYVFTYAVSPYEDWHRQAWAAALVLVVAVMLLNFCVRVLGGKRSLAADRDAWWDGPRECPASRSSPAPVGAGSRKDA